MVGREWGGREVKEIEVGKRIQIFSCKLNKFYGAKVKHGDYLADYMR